MPDEIILNYYDSLLKKSDVKLLAPSCWLNDNIISFAFEYYERDEFKDHGDSVVFVSPDVTQCVKLMSVAEASEMLKPLNLEGKEFAYFAVNDNRFADVPGGSHWSLLELVKSELRCYHYDSFHPSNLDASRDLFRILNSIFQDKLSLIQAETPQQTNSCDCGVYVIAIAESQCRLHCLRSTVSSSCLNISPKMIKQKRKDLQDLILYLSGGAKNKVTPV